MFTLKQATKGQKGSRGWSTPHPSCFTPGKEKHYPLYRRLGRPGKVQSISPLLPFNPRPFQLVASRYTGYAILAQLLWQVKINSQNWGFLRTVSIQNLTVDIQQFHTLNYSIVVLKKTMLTLQIWYFQNSLSLCELFYWTLHYKVCVWIRSYNMNTR